MSKTSFLYLLSILVFVFTACNEPTPIGDEFIDDADLLGTIFTDTLTLDVFLEKHDSLSANSGTDVLIGKIDDPIFGTSTANLYLQFAPTLSSNFVTGVDLITDTIKTSSDTTITFSISPEDIVILDSLVLKIDYSNGDRSIYGDTISNKIQSFNFYRIEQNLSDVISDSTNYFAETANLTIGENYGKYDVNFKPSTNYFTSATDTIGLSPQMRFRLPNQLGQEFLDAISNSQNNYFETDSSFVENFKGLYIQSSEQNTATAAIDLRNTSITLYYTAIDKDVNTNTQDTTKQVVILAAYESNPQTQTNELLHASQYIHDYTGTPIETILNNGGKITDKGYLQGMVGLNALVKIPYLEKLGNIVVNKAELEFTNIESYENLDTIFTPPIALISQLTNESSQAIINNLDIRVNNPLQVSTDSLTQEVYNTYKVFETFSTQKLVLEPTQNKAFQIAVTGRKVYPNRLIFEGPESQQKAIKLNLYYTPLD